MDFAISSRRIREFIEQALQTWAAPKLASATTRTSAAISISAAGGYSYNFSPSGNHQCVIEVILDSIHMPLQKLSPQDISNLRLGQTPAKSTYPQFYALEEIETDPNTFKILLAPDPNASDTLSVVTSAVPVALVFDDVGSPNEIPFILPMQIGLAQRVAGVCMAAMDDEELSKRKLGRSYGDFLLTQADDSLNKEVQRLAGFKLTGRIIEVTS